MFEVQRRLKVSATKLVAIHGHRNSPSVTKAKAMAITVSITAELAGL
jgi:hypothetical protein